MLNLMLSEIKRIEEIAKTKKNCISLSQGALKIGGIPNQIKKHVQQLLNSDKTDYYESAWGIISLREKLAQYLNVRHKTTLTRENIIVTHGSIGALSTIFLALLENGDEVIIPEPAYPAYQTLVLAARSKPVFVSCGTTEYFMNIPNWKLNVEAIKEATTKRTKIIVFSNPCNPTGKIFSFEEIKELVLWCEKNNIMLIADEVYDDYIFANSFDSATQFVEKSEIVVRTGSFSKNFSMSGWRVGYMVIPSYLNNQLGRMQDALLNCPNIFAQYAALYALEHPEFIVPFQKTIKQNSYLAQQLLQPLKNSGFLSFRAPQGGFNLFISTNFIDTSQLCEQILEHVGVTVVPGRAFGPSVRSYFRLCYARHPEIVEEGIKRISLFFEDRRFLSLF